MEKLKQKKWIWTVIGIIVVIFISVGIKKSIRILTNNILGQSPKYETLRKEDISSIPDEELVYAVVNWMWGKFNGDWSREYKVISSLPTPCQNIYSVYTVEGEVNNGGFNQCYYNSSKDFTKMAEEGFRAIEAVGFSDIMKKANLLYDEIKDELEQYNDGTIESFSKSYENNPLNELDDAFMSQYEEESLEKLYVDYIRENEQYFGD